MQRRDQNQLSLLWERSVSLLPPLIVESIGAVKPGPG